MAVTDPWAEFKPAPQSDPWAEFTPAAPSPTPTPGRSPFRGGVRGERTLRGEAQAPKTRVPTGGEIGQGYVDVGRGVAIGAPSGVFGIPGDVESLARLALYPVGVQQENQFAPNTARVGELIAGPPRSEAEAAGRLGGSMLGPGLMARAVRGGRAVTTADDFRSLGSAAYKAADQAGVVVSQPSFKGFVDNLKTTLAQEGIDAGLNPKAIAALGYLEGRAGENITLKGLEIARRNIGRVARSPDEGERFFGMQMKEALDDYIEAVAADPAAHVLMGDAKGGIEALRQARDYWAAARRTETIDDLVSSAELSTSRFTQSGFENALRDKFRAFANNPKKMRGLSREQQEAIRLVAKGGNIDNALRFLGKLKPTGAVSAIPSLLVGDALGPTAGMGVAALGAGARAGATAATMRNVEAAAEAMRRGVAVPANPAQLTGPTAPQMIPQALLAALLAQRANQP